MSGSLPQRLAGESWKIDPAPVELGVEPCSLCLYLDCSLVRELVAEDPAESCSDS